MWRENTDLLRGCSSVERSEPALWQQVPHSPRLSQVGSCFLRGSRDQGEGWWLQVSLRHHTHLSRPRTKASKRMV